MANFGPKPWSKKCQFLDFLNFLVLYPRKAFFFVLEYDKTIFPGLYNGYNGYNVLRLSVDWEGRGLVKQKRKSPDFRFPGGGVSEASLVPWLMASRKVPMDIYIVSN